MGNVVGIDEVGRGCLAGPLVAAAVVLDKRMYKLRDSKVLTKHQREVLAARIQIKALAYATGWVSPQEIDQVGMTKATSLAMKRALDQITCDYDEIIIDGIVNFLKPNPKAKTIVKADQTVPVVSAASIIAKVARDQFMTEIATKYPLYQFERHVGYGTRLHREMLKLHGHCDIHRLSFRPLKATLAEI
jgi:ribonuclease HII